MLTDLTARLRALFRRRAVERELDEELRFHLDRQVEAYEEAGHSHAEALRRARADVGGVAQIREEHRDMLGMRVVDGLWRDVRVGVRSLRRSPSLVVVSVLSLGLGIGLNALVYLAVDTIYGHQPTMADPEHVVGVEPGNANQFSYPDYLELQRSGVFEDALAFRATALNVGTGASTSPAGVLGVSPNFFQVLGVEAQIGRTFTSAAEQAPRVVVVTASYWRRNFGGDGDAVGTAITLGGEPHTLVGVLPDDYRAVTGWVGPEMYVPFSRLVLSTVDDIGSPSVTVLARVAPGTSAVHAQQAVTAWAAALERTDPERRAGLGRPARLFPARELQFRGTPAGMQIVSTLAQILVGLVLAIACVNVAGLLLAREARRRHEVAIRVALGAGRARIVQTMVVECLLLAVIGAVVCLPLVLVLNQIPWPGLRVLQSAMAPDGRLLPYSVALVLLTALACGVGPAVHATRAAAWSASRWNTGTATSRLRVRHILVAGQVAMALVLMVGTFLCARSQWAVGRFDLGFDVGHGVVVRFGMDANQYPGQERVDFAERVADEVARVPGISMVSVADLVPLGGDALARTFHPAGRTDIPGTRPQTYSVGPGYFRTLAIRHLQGRDFTSSDTADAPAVAIVNETFVETYFPGQDAIGERVETAGETDAEIVGVVGSYRIDTIGEAPKSVVYYPFAQRPRRPVVHARTDVLPERAVRSVSQVVERVDPSVPVSVETLRNASSLELEMRRAGTMLVGIMGTVGLVLALIGLYGVMAYVTASRAAEIGIRLALGVSPRRIRRDVLGQASGIVCAGVVVGAAASLGVAPAFSTFLAGIDPLDPMAYGGAALMLLAAGALAGYLPARRASRIDPARTLRLE